MRSDFPGIAEWPDNPTQTTCYDGSKLVRPKYCTHPTAPGIRFSLSTFIFSIIFLLEETLLNTVLCSHTFLIQIVISMPLTPVDDNDGTRLVYSGDWLLVNNATAFNGCVLLFIDVDNISHELSSSLVDG